MISTRDEVSLRDLIFKLKEWISYLRSKWLVLMVAGVIGGGIGILYAIWAKPKYKGELTFVLSGGDNTSSLLGLAGQQLGLDLGNSSGDDMFQGDNIVGLLQSQKIVERALFQKLPDSSEVLINILARESGMVEKWNKKVFFKEVFPFPKKETELSPRQDSLVREIHDFVVKKYLSIDKVDKKLSFYGVMVETPNEQLSSCFTVSLVNEAARFYIETKTKMAKDNLNMLKHEADSLRYLLGGAINAVASATDQTFNLNAALLSSRTGMQKSQFQAEVLGTAYGEVIKNMEIAKITLQKETPLFQIIDSPKLPLKKEKKSRLIWFVMGGFILCVLAMSFLVMKRMYYGIVNENDKV